MTPTPKLTPPRVGDTIHVYGMPAIVRRVLPLGTVELEREDGRWFRASGFAMLPKEATR